MAYNNNIPSYHDLRGLSIVWMRTIALSWEYLGQLLNNPLSPVTQLLKIVDISLESLNNQDVLDWIVGQLKSTRDEMESLQLQQIASVQGEIQEGQKALFRLMPDFKAWRFLYLLLVENDLTMVFKEYFNYQCPFSVNLKCALWAATWRPTKVNGDTVTAGQWENLAANEIFFHVPDNPNSANWLEQVELRTAANLPGVPSAMGNEAIALAAYLDSGSSYLFSCC